MEYGISCTSSGRRNTRRLAPDMRAWVLPGASGVSGSLGNAGGGGSGGLTSGGLKPGGVTPLVSKKDCSQTDWGWKPDDQQRRAPGRMADQPGVSRVAGIQGQVDRLQREGEEIIGPEQVDGDVHGSVPLAGRGVLRRPGGLPAII